MYVDNVVKYYVDENNNELQDVVESGKAIEVDGNTFREGIQVKVVTNKGVVYDGLLLKVSTLAPSSGKDLVVLDEFEVKHSIKYDLIETIKNITASGNEDDAN